MTLIVGIRCTDCVVVGSDSAITFGQSDRLPTIMQPFRQKIEVIDDRMIVAGTGKLGLGQRFVDIASKCWRELDPAQINVLDFGRIVAMNGRNDLAQTGAVPGEYGALVAVPVGSRAELIEFAVEDLQPELKTDESWYVSMGSGQIVADPLLGFFRKVFWGDDPPQRQDGVFAMTMVLTLACEMAPIGVAKPLQIAILSMDGGAEPTARRLTEEELLEHEGNVNEALDHFRQYRGVLSDVSGATRPPPQPPQ